MGGVCFAGDDSCFGGFGDSGLVGTLLFHSSMSVASSRPGAESSIFFSGSLNVSVLERGLSVFSSMKLTPLSSFHRRSSSTVTAVISSDCSVFGPGGQATFGGFSEDVHSWEAFSSVPALLSPIDLLLRGGIRSSLNKLVRLCFSLSRRFTFECMEDGLVPL